MPRLDDLIVGDGKIGVVIQGGGQGTRIGCVEPKPLIRLPNGDTCLGNLLQDIPDDIMTFLYCRKEQGEEYMHFLKDFGREMEIYWQLNGILYDKDEEQILFEDKYGVNKYIRVSNGPGTFARQLQWSPEYLVLIDGSKTGISWEEVLEAKKKLVEDDVDGLLFTREISHKEVADEIDRYKESRPRQSRVGMRGIYEHPNLPLAILADQECPAMTGEYLVRAKALKKKTFKMRGKFMPATVSIENKKIEGFAYQLKHVMMFSGYYRQKEGLSWDVFDGTKGYFSSIKTIEDVKKYRRRER